MGTPFEDIYDRFLRKITDYRLDNLARIDIEALELLLRGYLTNSIDLFDGCLNDLSYEEIKEEDESGNIISKICFVNELDGKEQSILAEILLYCWMEKEVNDIRQMQLHLQTRDFKLYSEANNFKQKNEYLDKIKEKYNHETGEYQWQNIHKLPFWGGK